MHIRPFVKAFYLCYIYLSWLTKGGSMLKGYKLRLLPVLFLVFSFVLAQSFVLTSARGEAAIQGVVMDALTGKAIPDAKVVIWDVYAY